MKNPATNKPGRDDFNTFTEFVLRHAQAGNKPLVRLRNGRIVEVYWFDKELGYESFASDTGGCFRWNNDGTSITSRDFDMMETV